MCRSSVPVPAVGVCSAHRNPQPVGKENARLVRPPSTFPIRPWECEGASHHYASALAPRIARNATASSERNRRRPRVPCSVPAADTFSRRRHPRHSRHGHHKYARRTAAVPCRRQPRDRIGDWPFSGALSPRYVSGSWCSAGFIFLRGRPIRGRCNPLLLEVQRVPPHTVHRVTRAGKKIVRIPRALSPLPMV